MKYSPIYCAIQSINSISATLSLFSFTGKNQLFLLQALFDVKFTSLGVLVFCYNILSYWPQCHGGTCEKLLALHVC